MNNDLTKAPWYPKAAAGLVIVLIVLATFVIGMKYQKSVSDNMPTDVPADNNPPLTGKPSFTDPRNGIYEIDGERIVLVNGTATESIPNSASTIVTSVFGEPVQGDLDGDGDLDAVLFLVQETSGTGIPFYVTAAVNVSNGNINTGYIGTNAIFIGDRIAPQNINVMNGVAAVHYATRRESDPMIEPPTIGATKYFDLKDGQLVEVTASDFSPNAPVPNTSSNDGAHLFSVKVQHDNISSVVGYFGAGSFFWYVPDWLVENWTDTTAANDLDMRFTPKEVIPGRKFSDITISVATSTERHNALFLYENDRRALGEGTVVVDEVLLNKQTQGGISIDMETNTRIYHVQREYGGTTHDYYYIDGSGGRTAFVMFSAPTIDFPKYANKIKEMVQGIGMGTPPQG